jgi:hypothetical protein
MTDFINGEKIGKKHKWSAANSTFAIGGVTCFNDTFVVKRSSVLRRNICAEKPAHRKSANRYSQW